jgi:hypothetical protein
VKSSNPKTRISVGTKEPTHQDYMARMSSWHALAGEMVAPTSIIEKSFGEILDTRHRASLGFPKRAGVLSTGPLGLLATMVLRLKGIEVVFMDLGVLPSEQSCQAGDPANENSKLNRYSFTRRRLAKEVGAVRVNATGRTIRKFAEKLGPFDLIFVDSSNSSTVMQALFGLNKGGVLVDLSKGMRRMQVYETRFTPHFALRHDTDISHGEINARSSRDLAIADLEYPGWLEEFFVHSREKFSSRSLEVLAGIQSGSLVNRRQSMALAGWEG